VHFEHWVDEAEGAAVNDNEITWSGAVTAGEAVTFTFIVTYAGDWSQTVTNTARFGGAQQSGSAAATFTVVQNTPPTLSDIPNQTITQGQVLTVSITISDAETPVSSLTLGAQSSNTALVPVSGIVFGGTGTERTVAITPAYDMTGTTTMTIGVSDGADTTAKSFVVTVNEAPPGSYTCQSFSSTTNCLSLPTY
jgi:hypothetical protein